MAEYPYPKKNNKEVSDRYWQFPPNENPHINKTPDYIKESIRKIPLKPAKISTFEEDVNDIAFELVQLLVKKHKDYGPKNISQSPGGALNGLRVRMHDKLARINHLIDSGAIPSNESLEDSYADLANYAIIALMVQKGKWPTK